MYPPSSKEKLKAEYKEIEAILLEGYEKGFFCQKDLDTALPDKACAGKLYNLPKDDKPVRPESGIPPLGGVVSRKNEKNTCLKSCTKIPI